MRVDHALPDALHGRGVIPDYSKLQLFESYLRTYTAVKMHIPASLVASPTPNEV